MELPLLGNLQSVTFKLLPANSKQQIATHNPKSEPPTQFSLTKLFDFEVSAVGSAMEWRLVPCNRRVRVRFELGAGSLKR